MFKKILMLIALGLPVSVFADGSFYFTTGKVPHDYQGNFTINYTFCPNATMSGTCAMTTTPKTIQLQAGIGDTVLYGTSSYKTPATTLLSVTDSNGSALSQDALDGCSKLISGGTTNILVFYYPDDNDLKTIACKGGGFRK